jgi:alkylation response protein AidB-like acyl-CoA dehydrogenase
VDFSLTYTPEQERFRAEVRTWLAESVPPGINARPASHEESYRLYLMRRELGRRLGAKGWLYPSAPTEYGGGGLDFDSVIILEEETDRLGLGLPPYYDSGGRLGSGTIRVWGTEEQKQAFLPPIYRGEVRTWQLLTEPDAGSDLAGVKSTAIHDGDWYILNGQKIFVGSSHGADRLWVIAVTDPHGERHHNLSWFMIDASLPGITIHPQFLLSASGEGAADPGHKNTVYFEDVRIPAFARIGEENAGWRVASTHLELEHGSSGSLRQNPIWTRLLTHCQTTERDGVKLIDDPAIRARLAVIYSRLELVRLFAARNFWMSYAGKPKSYEGPQASYLRKVTGLWLTREILDIVGPSALTNDPEWGAMSGYAESQQRSGIVDVHPGGTPDIQSVIIARRLGIGRRSKEEAGRVLHSADSREG